MPLLGWHGCVLLRNSLEVERKAEAIAVKANTTSVLIFLLEQKKEDTQKQQSYGGKYKIEVT